MEKAKNHREHQETEINIVDWLLALDLDICKTNGALEPQGKLCAEKQLQQHKPR